MKTYRVKPEFIDKWSNDYEWSLNPIVTEEEIYALANLVWDVSVEDLMEQVTELEC